eukprot:5409531-Karenia_brevis.AAC.1
MVKATEKTREVLPCRRETKMVMTLKGCLKLLSLIEAKRHFDVFQINIVGSFRGLWKPMHQPPSKVA